MGCRAGGAAIEGSCPWIVAGIQAVVTLGLRGRRHRSSGRDFDQGFWASKTRSTHVVSTRPEMKSASRKIRR